MAEYCESAHEPCESCAVGDPEEEDAICPKSKRPCGHHCNHVWTHDDCDWCDQNWWGQTYYSPKAILDRVIAERKKELHGNHT